MALRERAGETRQRAGKAFSRRHEPKISIPENIPAKEPRSINVLRRQINRRIFTEKGRREGIL